MLRIVLACVAFMLCVNAQADEDAIARFRNYLPNEIMKIPEKERSNSVPIMYLGAANMALSPAADVLFSANLNSLMYNGVGDFEGAKRAFQADLGEASTGELTVWQIYTLGYRASRATLTQVSFFPFDFGGTIVDGWATVKGTVTMLDEKIAYPVNHVVIKCDRSRSMCDYRQIALMLPDEKSFSQSYNVSQIADESYRITRWDNDQIDAIPLSATGCRINQLSLNFATKEFFEITRNNKEGDCDIGMGVKLPKLEKPRVSQIVDGQSIVEAQFKSLNDEVFQYLSSAFRKRVTALKAK